MPGQQAVLFVDGAPTRGNVRALEIFQEHGVLVITFPPHLTHVLQPVDVSWARRFKSLFVQFFRSWGKEDLQPFLRSLLNPTRELSAVMLKRGQIVAAACEAAQGATQMSLCMRAFLTTGLADHEGGFGPERPLSSDYVRLSDEDPERDRPPAPGRLPISSRLITDPEFVQALRERAAAKPRWRRKRGGDRGEIGGAEAEDVDNFLAADGEAFEGFAMAARRAAGPDPTDDDAVQEE